jgi:hypothetical protein
VYQNVDECLESLPGLVEWLFSHIIEVVKEAEPVIEEETWQDKWITVGIRSGVSQRWYTESEEFAPGAHALNFEGGLFVSVHLISLFSLQVEADFTFDNLVYRGVTLTGKDGTHIPLENVKYTTYSLMFPLLFKVNFRPGNFRIAPLAGVYAFLPLGDAAYRAQPAGKEGSFSWSANVPLGYTLGVEAAIELGPGILVADIRYAGDLGTVAIHDAGDTTVKDTSYKRRMVSFTLGYAFGFIRKRTGYAD